MDEYFKFLEQKENERQMQKIKHVPKDLGQIPFLQLQELYKKRTKMSTNNDQLLFDLWKNIKQNPPKIPDYIPTLLSHHPEDIQLTLIIHSKIIQQKQDEEKIQKQKEQKENEEKKKQQKEQQYKRKLQNQKQKISELYKTQNQVPQQEPEENFGNKFTQLLIVLHKKKYPETNHFKNEHNLYQFWFQEIRNKHEKELNVSQQDAKKYIRNYFEEKALDFFHFHRKKRGFDTFEYENLLEFYQSLTLEEKKRHDLVFNSEEDFQQMIDLYLQKVQEIQKQEDEAQKKQEEEQKKQKEALLKRVLNGKNIKSHTLDALAIPKDRLVIGKQLLVLRKEYPTDKVLRKMILDEFQFNKVTKIALEYDVKDENEENRIKQREVREVRLEKGKELLSLQDLEKPLNEQTYYIASLFEQEIENYYYLYTSQEDQKDYKQTLILNQGQKLKKYVEKKALEFIQMRKQRFYSDQRQKFGINFFLQQTYLELYQDSKYSYAMKAYFEDFSRKNKRFTPKFKAFFFKIVRQFAYENLKRDKIKKLPFWAPSGIKGNSHNYTISNFYNIKNKHRNENEQHPNSTLWSKQMENKKLKIMMKFEDAKECTFAPMVGCRAPEYIKKYLKEETTIEYAQEVLNILFSKKPNFENWVDKLGPQLQGRFPKIYRFGIYKKCLRLLKNYEYKNAFKIATENFNIKEICSYFDKNSIKKLDFLFQIHPQKYDKNEVFLDSANLKFLEDIYVNVIQAIIFQQKLLIKDNEHNTTFRNQSLNMHDRFPIKTQICPLKNDCPDLLKTRWPHGDFHNSMPIGKNCKYAHTISELRFLQEKKAQLNAVNKRIENVEMLLHNQTDNTVKAWNPSNNLIEKCFGCGGKGGCSLCQFKHLNETKTNSFREKTQRSNSFYRSKKSFQQKQDSKKEIEDFYIKKRGCLQKTEILFKRERFIEAFNLIGDIVCEIKDKIEENKQNGEEDKFINNQIEEMYFKIQKELNKKKNDVENIKKTIEKIENNEFRQSQKVKEFVSNEMHIKNLQSAISFIQTNANTTPAQWNPTSAQDAILPLEKLNEKIEKEKLSKSQFETKLYNLTYEQILKMPLNDIYND